MNRVPGPALRPFVRQLWAATSPLASALGREHTLPCGDMHLVLRPSGESVRLFAADASSLDIGAAVVGGIRTAFYVKEVPNHVSSVGVTFHPAAAHALFGYTAEELAGRHVPLEALWRPRTVAELRERLLRPPHPKYRSRSSKQQYLCVKDAGAAIDFYTGVFGAVERFRLDDPTTSRVAHAEVQIGGSTLMLAEEYPELGLRAPITVGVTR